MVNQYHIITIGCAMNVSDSQRLATQLNQLGWQETNQRSSADLVVLVTCGVRQGAEDRIYGLIKQIKKDNPQVKLALTGCLSYRQDVFNKVDSEIDYWFNITQLPELLKIIPSVNNQLLINQSTTNQLTIDNYLQIPANHSSTVSALVPIGNGCNNFCSYCVVPYARGREKYRPAQEIITEVQQLISQGYQEITLIAQNVNSYLDSSNNLNFTDLLSDLDQLGEYWLRFSTSHPKDISQQLIKLLSTSQNLVHHLHLPVQSGSNRILKAMNRGYTAEHYLKLVKQVRQAWPDVSLTSDIIVGFPGETDQDFQKTIQLVDQVAYDQVYIAQFSPRPGTAAAKLTDNISSQLKKEREQQLDQIVKLRAHQNRQTQIGQTVEVLIEEQRNNKYFGRTSHNHQILLTTNQLTNYQIGHRYLAQVEQARNFSLAGQLL